MGRVGIRIGLVLGACLATACAGAGPSGQPARVSGTVTTREPVALVPGTRVHVQLVALSPQGDSPTVIGEQIILDPGFLPIPFEVPYDPSQIDPRGTYAVEARLRSGQTVLFVSDRPARVITGGNPARVQLVLVRIH